MQSFRPSIKLNVDFGSKLKLICKDTWKKRQPEHESMCSTPFLTISEKLHKADQDRDVFCGGCQKFNSAWISNKEAKCKKASLSLSHFTFYAVKKPVFYYRSIHLTGQTALVRLSAKV